MEKKASIEKLFGVLVLGGVAMAQTGGANDIDPSIFEVEKHCQMELVSKSYDMLGELQGSSVTCIDKIDDEMVALLIKEARKKSCATPFCGCWLG